MRPMIVYVESPGQLVCAVEYLRRTGCQGLILARTTKNAFANAQLANSIQMLNLAPDGYFCSGKLFVLAAYFYFYLITRRPRELVIGDSRSLVGVFFANHFRRGKTVLVDDGIATITHAIRARGVRRQFATGLTGGRLKNEVLRWFSGISRHMGVFSLIDSGYLGLESTANDFRSLAAEHAVTYEADHICIIGSSVVEAGVLSEKAYNDILESFLMINPQARITYVPHRLERLAKLSGLPRLSVTRAELPIELHFLRHGSVPGTFATFYSGAGLGLSRLFPGSTVLVKEIPVDWITPAHHTNYLNIVAMYRHHESLPGTGIRLC
jgi:hypothetical protein